MSNKKWNDDKVQFARLLCELVAANSVLNIKDVAESMDLTTAEVNELFDRADHVWECAKMDTARGLKPAR